MSATSPTAAPAWDVVIPTVGRPSLERLLAALVPAVGRGLERVLIADDRPPGSHAPLLADRCVPEPLVWRVEVHRSGGRGPAAARNVGWRAGRAPWVVFLDDDVLPPGRWVDALIADLRDRPADVAGVQARIVVPLPPGRRPTDQERSDLALADARWATADMAYRRAALHAARGFDERFPRAYREDAEIALRLRRAGWTLAIGDRLCLHPPRTAPWHASVRRQRGNADDPLMRVLHGRDWRAAADVPRGTRRRHAATVAAGLGGLTALATGRRTAATLLLGGWAALTGRFAAERIVPGPRTPREVAAMLATSVAIPPAAVGHWLRGAIAARRLPDRRPLPTAGPPAPAEPTEPATSTAPADTDDPAPGGRIPARPSRRDATPVEAVLFDRDGTLVIDVPYNGDPERVTLVPGARAAVERLRAAGIAVGLVSNQSGIARGLLTPAQVDAVNARVAELVGPLDPILYCPHGPDDGCACRKPQPGMVLRALRALDVPAARCAVIGDIGADVEAARAAGARGILVPTAVTRPQEVAAAPEVAADLREAVDRLLADRVVAA